VHLSYSMSTYKGKVYKSYALAESYRNDGKVSKRILWKIGKLTEVQAAQIRLICHVAQDVNQVIARLQDIIVTESKAYLDAAVVNALWERWELDTAFEHHTTRGELPTHLLARILTINRCCAPCSHYSLADWAHNKVALTHVLQQDLSGLNDDKIYYELDKIHANKQAIEQHLFSKTFNERPESYHVVDYDLTTSYFVGCKCHLSAYGKGKIDCQGRRQVVLGVLINDDGYPFTWDVYPGNTAEVKTLKNHIQACKTRFGLWRSQVTLVFDRGILSGKNAEVIADAKMKYISALDRNQIPNSGVRLDAFTDLLLETRTDKVSKPGVLNLLYPLLEGNFSCQIPVEQNALCYDVVLFAFCLKYLRRYVYENPLYFRHTALTIELLSLSPSALRRPAFQRILSFTESRSPGASCAHVFLRLGRSSQMPAAAV
jgi:hypothetical protein